MASLLMILALLINVTGYGVPVVKMTVCGGNLYTNVTLPLAALPSTMIVVNRCSGTPVNFIPSVHYVVVPESSCACPLEIEYIGKAELTSNLTFTLNIDLSNVPSNTSVRLIYSKNVVIIPYSLTGLTLLPNNTVFMRGGQKYQLSYIVLTPLKTVTRPASPTSTKTVSPAKPTTNRTTSTSPRPTSVSPTRSTSSSTRVTIPSWLVGAIAGLVIAIVAITLVIVLIRRRIKTSTPHISQVSAAVEDTSLLSESQDLELREIDREIIRVLKERGGALLQRELYNILNVPKTTLWRAVRRLEKLGFVKIEKLGRLNRIVLLRDL